MFLFYNYLKLSSVFVDILYNYLLHPNMCYVLIDLMCLQHIIARLRG
jgi:hypothetical protein